VEEDGVPLGEETVASVRSLNSVPVILFEGGTRTYDPSIFDLVITQRTPPNDWLRRVGELIERSRAIRAETKFAGERHRSLIEESASLVQASATVRLESQHARAMRKTPQSSPSE